MSTLLYKPPATVERFMRSDAFVRCLVGPVGSGKSMGAIMELLRRAVEQTPHNGVRYTRFACVRNTLQQLKQTVLNDIQQYLGPITQFYATDSTIKIRMPLPDGTTVHSDWLLIPLDTKDDQRRLLSLQLTAGWLNEAREIPIEIISALLGRLGRYPSAVMGGPSWAGLIMDTNPWDVDHPLHEKLVLNRSGTWELFHQPSGIGPDAENVENLPAGYYERLADGRDDDWSAVHVESQFGASNAGQAVFRRSFHAPDHVRDIQMIVNPHRPLMVGLDFGRTPSALITQVDNYGRLIVFEEIVTEDMGLTKMATERLRPALMQSHFAGRKVFIVGDPAGQQKSQATEETLFDVLRGLGFMAYPASTNDVDKRIVAVERMLLQRIAGEPALQISRTGCPTLISALGNKYRYRRKKSDGQLDDKPEKLHPWSDIADALQYAILGTQVNLTGWVVSRDRPRRQAGPRITAAAWT